MAEREIPPPVPLYRVLIDEYESQQVGPPLPEGFVERYELAARPALERENPPADPRDPEGAARRERRIRKALDDGLVAAFYRFLHERGVRRSALCLSGGGIRSATFGLGLVQGLAQKGLLSRFDYLSTVSGGGYLGSWLSAWIRRHGLAEVEAKLASPPASPLAPEPEPIQHLRSYSRYMSPKLGLLSADTWTLAGIFLRNLLLNWLVFLPLIAAALLFPRLSTAVLHAVSVGDHERVDRWVLGATVLLGIFVVAYSTASRPSLANVSPPISRLPARYRSQGWFLSVSLLPLWVLAVGATLYWAWTDLLFFGLDSKIGAPLAFALFGAALGLGGFLLSRLWVSPRRVWRQQPGPAPLRLLATLREPVTLTGVAAFGGVLSWLVASHLFPFPDLQHMPDTEIYVCFGAPLLLLMFLAAATIFVGLASNYTADADREWWARAGSWILILIVVRAALSGVVVFGPLALERLHGTWRAVAASLGGISGLVTLFLGSSAKTAPARGEGGGKEATGAAAIVSRLGLAVAAPVFALFLLVLLSMGTGLLLRELGTAFFGIEDWKTSGEPSYDTLHLLAVVHRSPVGLVLLVAAIFLAVGLVMGRFVNINRFSLHAAYRDRLIRAYLGASRAGAERRPDPFTRFDEGDNLPMADLAANRPLPLLNLTLNLVSGKNPAWQDRKAEPFSVTPFHAGSYCLGYREARGYARSPERPGGITLGTAMAISGAAASPNMGYHSSSAVTFLMTLFNVRLGWWLGNPGTAGARTFHRPGPRFTPRPLFAEAFGLTDDANPYVYLSDGGHFENLGLYEMVLRRCQVILVSDAGQDEEFAFADLGSAIAKIRIDLGVPIRFAHLPMRRCAPDYAVGADPAKAVPFWAVGTIGYSEVDRLEDGTPARDGVLLYVKTSLNGTEPVDVFNYAKAHPSFPHESTADQLYTEAQFESYRALGFHAATTACGGESLADILQAALAGTGRNPKEAPGAAAGVANDVA